MKTFIISHTRWETDSFYRRTKYKKKKKEKKKEKKKKENSLESFSATSCVPSNHHWHNVFLLNPLSWSRWDHCLNVLNLVSIEEAVKLSIRMRWLSPLFWNLCEIKRCQAERGHFQMASWVLLSNERGFKRKHTSDEQVKTAVIKWLKWTVNRILRGKDTCSHSKVEYCYWRKQWLYWEVGMWSTEDWLHLGVWYLFLC